MRYLNSILILFFSISVIGADIKTDTIRIESKVLSENRTILIFTPTDIKFYVSYGSKDMKQVKKWTSRLIDNLIILETDKLHWTSEIFDGENHNTSDKISIKNGLRYRKQIIYGC